MQLAAGGAAVLALSLASGELTGWSLQQVTQRGILSLAFLIVGGTVLGFGAYTWLLRVTTPAAVGTYGFVNPVVALALAWAVGDEPFSARTVAAGLTVLGAVALIWSSSTKRQPSTSPERAGLRLPVERAGSVPGPGLIQAVEKPESRSSVDRRPY